MRYAQFERTGDPEVLEVVEAPTPEPIGNEVLLEIRASGVNPFDAKQRAGVYGQPRSFPQRTGFDGAGVIVAVGPEVDRWSVGDRVLTTGALGTAATHLVVKPSHLVEMPEGVDFERAASVGVPAGTAYQALRSLEVGPGDVVLIHGGSGAVGQAAIQFARARGTALVIATASAANLPRIEALGAVGVEYGPGTIDRVRAAAGDHRVTVVLDIAGSDEAFESVELLEDRARWATIVAGARADAAGLTAYSGGSEVPLTSDQHALRRLGISSALHGIVAGDFEVEIAEVLPLDRIADAHRAVETRAVRGKVLVRP